MSANHTGNLLNQVTFEEHDGTNNAKRVNVVAGGAGDGSILDGVTTTIKASVISTASGSALITYPLSGPTVYAVVNTSAAGVGNSIVTVANTPLAVSFGGNVTLDDGSLTGIVGNVTLSDPKGFIGLVSVSGFANPLPVSFSGNVTLDDGSLTGIVGNVTLSDAKTFIGLTTTTLGASPAFIGIVTVTNIARTITGNVTLSDPKGFIGLVTAVPGYRSTYTSFSTVISTTGGTTIVIPPAGQKVFVKNIYVSSLGRSEVSAWAIVGGGTTISRVPWTALSTTAGISEYYGEDGIQWGQADEGLNFALNGTATVGVKAIVRFAA